ncbi:MAG: elongation factor 4 [Parcubacteria group bacterium]|nr:elongation factor 4 [Parcubacteria group bacterium]
MNIRNFCIIAHIDHGKSTLADRFLEFTKTVEKRVMKEQLLDSMDLERERGITIKLQPVRMNHRGQDGQDYILNLIDTPGHVDFSYEVSRSLAAVEGAILLVDCTQGIQAQTLANLYFAMDQNLTIIPVANKADLPSADIEGTVKAIQQLLGEEAVVTPASGKTGLGIEEIVERIINEVPPPVDNSAKPLRAIIFDSMFDDYRGAVAYIRVMDGQLRAGQTIRLMASGRQIVVQEVGVFKPQLVKGELLSAGEIGYIVTGLKEVTDVRVGDTVADPAVTEALPGYREMKSMVFAGIFCKNGDDYPRLRESMDRLKLSDAALTFEPENSAALGFGFRSGFLGLLHLEIVQERLKREFNMDLIVTAPSVAYLVTLTDGSEPKVMKSPQDLPEASRIATVQEPMMKIDIITPTEYVGSLMQMIQERRGKYKNTEYISEDRAILHYRLPLSVMLIDFYDRLKSISAGYASLNYELDGYEVVQVERLDILVAEEKVEPLATIVYKDEAYEVGRKIVDKLKEVLPRHMFEVKIQSAIGGKVVASARLAAMRKDVTGTLSGGDVSRKRKLLEKQKKGKKKMKAIGMGKVDIGPDAFMAVLKR